MDADDAEKALSSVQLARDHARCGRHGAATAGLMQVGVLGMMRMVVLRRILVQISPHSSSYCCGEDTEIQYYSTEIQSTAQRRHQ